MRWGTWTSSPHRKPGGASRTQELGEEGTEAPLLVQPGPRPWCSRTLSVPQGHVPLAWCFSPHCWGSQVTPAPQALLPDAEPNPAGDWVCTAGCPEQGSFRLGRTWGPEEDTQPAARSSPVLAWGGSSPPVLCLMGRPNHRPSWSWGPAGLLHRNPELWGRRLCPQLFALWYVVWLSAFLWEWPCGYIPGAIWGSPTLGASLFWSAS